MRQYGLCSGTVETWQTHQMHRGTIVSVNKAGWSILGDEFLQALGQGIGRPAWNCGQEGLFAEEIAYEQVLFAFVGAVIGCNLLPWAIGDVPGEHQLSKERDLVLFADSALADIICYVCVDARPVDVLSCLCLHLLHPMVGSIHIS